MEKKPLRKLTKHHVFLIIYGVLALSAVAVFWIFNSNPISEIYNMAALWLVLPVGSMIISYSMTEERGPKGLVWLLPLAFGATMCAVEFLTFSLEEIIKGVGKMPSITLLVIGAFASLVGFTIAKQDRVEKERTERAKKKKEAKAAAKAARKLTEAEIVTPETGENTDSEAQENAFEAVAHEDDYNPGADFIPDENDTWADEVLEREGYGKEHLEYAESDADFSIDMPEESESAENENDAADFAQQAADAVESIEETEGETESAPEEIEENTIEESGADESQESLDEDLATPDEEESAEEIAEDDAIETEVDEVEDDESFSYTEEPEEQA